MSFPSNFAAHLFFAPFALFALFVQEAQAGSLPITNINEAVVTATQSPSADCNPPAVPQEPLAELAARLQEFYSKRIVVLDRDVTTFHYEGNHGELSLAKAMLKISTGARSFFDPSALDSSSSEGPGIYLAVDPAASRGYGGDQPRLFTMEIKKGTRLFDDLSPPREAEQKEFEAMVNQAHCQGSDIASGMVLPFRGSGDSGCRKAVGIALKNLGVGAILYNFYGSSSIEGCRTGRNIAFSLVSGDALKSGSLQLFAGKPNEAPSDARLRALFQESGRDPQLLVRDNRANFDPSLVFAETKAPDPVDFLKWKQDHLASCGPAWVYEQIPYQALEYAVETSPDAEKNRAQLVETAIAFGKAFPYQAFDPTKLGAVEDALKARSPKISDWVNIHNTLDPSEADGANLEQRLEGSDMKNPHPGMSFPTQLSDALAGEKIPAHPTFQFVQHLFEKAGWAEQQSRILADTYLLQHGQAPNLLSNGKTAEDTALDNEKFEAILKHCRDVYEAAAKAKADVSEAGCLVRR